MVQALGGILDYETTLDAAARQQVQALGSADIVIGIPCHRNGRTIGGVAQAIATGVGEYLPGKRVVLMASDGGSSDSTLRHVEQIVMPPNLAVLTTEYQGPGGKGTGVRSVFEVTAMLQARACAIFEARAPGIVGEWVPALVDPVLQGYDAVLPQSGRDPFTSSLSENIVRPFLRTFFGVDLQSAVQAEFALSGPLAADLANRDVWETDVARFGINVWIPTMAILERWKVVQTSLGDRGDGLLRPVSLTDGRFLQAVGTLFRMLSTHRRAWQGELEPREIAITGGPSVPTPVEGLGDNLLTLQAAAKEGRRRFSGLWPKILRAETLEAAMEAIDQTPAEMNLPDALWSQIVLQSAISFSEGEGDPDKVIESLLPLFYTRTIQTMQAATAAEDPISHQSSMAERLAQAFADARPEFVRQWRENLPYGTDQAGSWFM